VPEEIIRPDLRHESLMGFQFPWNDMLIEYGAEPIRSDRPVEPEKVQEHHS
jgi:hypothetical protein